VRRLRPEPEQRHGERRAGDDTAQHPAQIPDIAPVPAHEAPRRRAQLLARAGALAACARDERALAGDGESGRCVGLV